MYHQYFYFRKFGITQLKIINNYFIIRIRFLNSTENLLKQIHFIAFPNHFNQQRRMIFNLITNVCKPLLVDSLPVPGLLILNLFFFTIEAVFQYKRTITLSSFCQPFNFASCRMRDAQQRVLLRVHRFWI